MPRKVLAIAFVERIEGEIERELEGKIKGEIERELERKIKGEM